MLKLISAVAPSRYLLKGIEDEIGSFEWKIKECNFL
jgi:hypothetical protein